MIHNVVTHSLSETEEFAKKFARTLLPGSVVTLTGDLGSGKTAFTQLVATQLGATQRVNSPTFLIQKEYSLYNDKQISTLYHFDLYRLQDSKDVTGVGLKEVFSDKHGIVFIEWPDKAQDILPKNSIHLTFKYINETTREIIMS